MFDDKIIATDQEDALNTPVAADIRTQRFPIYPTKLHISFY